MRITHDPETAAVYVYLIEPDGRKLRTEELGDGVMIDRGPGGEVVGIELLNVPGNRVDVEKLAPPAE